MMKKKGSITIFLTLILTCFFSAVFALLEAARVSGLKANVECCTVQAADGVMASYHRELWQQYHLLFWQIPPGDQPDLNALQSLQKQVIDRNYKTSMWPKDNYYVLQVQLSEVQVSGYQLATDARGLAFQAQAAEMMKSTMGEDVLQAVFDWLNAQSERENGEMDLEEKALEALEDLKQAGESSRNEVVIPEESRETEGSNEIAAVGMTENPLEWVKKVKKNGIYAFLMPEEDISQQSIDLSTCIERRSLQTGTMNADPSGDGIDKLLFRMYLQKYFKDALDDGAGHALEYEMEYMIMGKDGDEANLKGVVRRLLLMREAANLAFLETNTQKQQEAGAIAAALVTVVGQPELEPLVRQGILAAWAFAESLSDVRILLNGGKVSLVKTQEQWHTDIFHLSSSFTEEGEKQETGLSYANYLQLLLWVIPDQKLAYRGMDLMEKNMSIKMDSMLACAECEYVYEADSLFSNFVSLGQKFPGGYRFRDQGRISYY